MDRILKLKLMAIMLMVNSAFSQNPILKDMGVSDPHIRVFNDTIYLYSGHDATPEDKTWVMRDWRVFATTDLVNWTLRDTISPKDNFMDDRSTDCWAGDAASRNGKYYFYFSDRKRGVGVMTSHSPTGPFKDALDGPLVSPMHDPTVLIDNDEGKTPYLVYGDKEGGGFHIAKLNDDMISTAEKPKPLTVEGKEWDKAPEWMDKNYLFKHDDTYYLSWGRDYAVSNDIYGPYKTVGAVGEGYKLGEYAHGSFFEWKGQFYHIWCRYLRDGYKFRESMITYCHIDDDGKIVTDVDFLNQHFDNGVGRYEASWDKIEAEWFYSKSDGIQKQGTREKGFTLTNMADGNHIAFANLNFDTSYKKMTARLSLDKGKGTLEIRTGGPDGKRLGRIKMRASQKQGNWQYRSAKISAKAGKKDLYFVLKGDGGNMLSMDWIKFEK